MRSENVAPGADAASVEGAPVSGDNPVLVCTIIARNYLPQARVLAWSFERQHPGGRFVALVIDDLHGEVHGEPFEVWRPENLDLEPAEFHRMAAMYDVMALATALKPWLLEALLAEGVHTVIYLDPDIRLYGPLDEVVALANRWGIVLTPHLTGPIPIDRRRVTETDILGSGIYNLGFIALGSTVTAFLEFWKERLRLGCYVEPQNQRFVDQRWVDFVPGMFGCYVLRDPSYNVAYWNLGHRDLAQDGPDYTVDGQPLKFFHFSGFNPRRPYVLSKHQGERPWILLSERPAVAKICEDYSVALDEEGFSETPPGQYAFDVLPNGIVLNEKLRRIYREWLSDLADDDKEAPSDPFSIEGAEGFATYLTSPAKTSRLPIYLRWEWYHRADLQAVFPQPEGADYDRVLSWAEHEVFNGRLHPRLVQWERLTQRLDGRQWAAPAETVPGVCVAGYLHAELGTGEAGRLVLETVRRAGIEAGTVVYRNTMSRQDHPLEEQPRTDLNVNVIAVNGDQLDTFAAEVGPQFFEGRYNIGFWAWEGLEEPPRGFQHGLRYLDEIWTVSEFSKASLAQMTDKPIHTLPYPMSQPTLQAGLARTSLGLPDGFVFLFCFDLFSVLERKNPAGLIRAFKSAFEPGEGPTLVIKVINGEIRLADLEQLRYQVRDRPDIQIIDRYLDAAENRALMAACDCYVSLHRSEGFGLTMAEAMALGRPVIATGYSGNLDFMGPDNSYLVPWELVEVPPGCEPYPAGDHWAEPDLEVAARLMRQVVDNPEVAAAVARRGQKSVLESHSFASAVPFVRARFRHAEEALSHRTDTSVAPLRNLASSPTPLDGPSSHPAIASVLRRVVRRAVAHQELHRQNVEVALADAVGVLSSQVDSLHRRVEELASTDVKTFLELREVVERVTGLESRDRAIQGRSGGVVAN